MKKVLGAGGGAFLLLLMATLLIPTGAATAGGSGDSAPLGTPVQTDASPLFPWLPSGGFPDPFPYGQCTYWVASNVPVSWDGNAGDWLVNAAAQGRATSTLPAVGEIAVYWPGDGYSDLGHVAVVVAVESDEAGAITSYTVSEMNFLGGGQDPGLVDRRQISWPDPHVQGLILA